MEIPFLKTSRHGEAHNDESIQNQTERSLVSCDSGWIRCARNDGWFLWPIQKSSPSRLAGLALILILGFGLTACGSTKDKKDQDERDAPSKRISALEAIAETPTADPNLDQFAIALQGSAVNRDWDSSGGNTEHVPGNPALNVQPREVWSTSIGSGSDKDFKLIGSPLIGGNTAYAIDAKGRVSAYDLEDGDRKWRVETAPPKEDDDAMGGGIALDSNVVYVATGFGEVLALHASNGSVIWRANIGKPLRSAPTVLENRVFVVTIENETQALDAQTGRFLWRHSGIAENATLMGSTSAAAHGDLVVVAYSSGEVFGLRAQNGRVVWGEVLATSTKIGALPAIADIRGLPVIDRDRVFAVSHSGRSIAIDVRTGERAWEADIGGLNTPSVADNAVFIVTNDSQLIAMTRESGRIVWVVQLQKQKDPSDRDSKKIRWSGPVLAGSRLWLTNSMGQVASYDPQTGKNLSIQDVADAFYLPPIVANRTILLLSDNGRLIAMR